LKDTTTHTPDVQEGMNRAENKFQQFQRSIVDLLQLIRPRVEVWQMEITQLVPRIKSQAASWAGTWDWGK